MTDKEKIEYAHDHKMISEDDYQLLMWRLKAIKEISYNKNK